MPQYLRLDEATSTLGKLIGDNTRRRRSELSMTQAELAERTGIAASHLSYIEHGKANPTLEVLEHLAEGLGWSIIDLLSGANDLGS